MFRETHWEPAGQHYVGTKSLKSGDLGGGRDRKVTGPKFLCA